MPAGQNRCVKLLFTAETACGPTGGPDFCYVEAIVDGVPMNPDGAGFQALDSEHRTAGARAYEWVKRVGPGPHTIGIRWRVLAAGTQFYVDDSTFDVQLAPVGRHAGRRRAGGSGPRPPPARSTT